METVQQRWKKPALDPLFAMVDGANCPSLKPDDERAHSPLLKHGLFRVGMPWPPRDASGKPFQPEFSIAVVKDPAGCNLDARYGINSATPTVSVYRRPRMSANLRYVTTSFSLSGRFDGKTGLPLAIDPKTGQRVGLPHHVRRACHHAGGPGRDAIRNRMQAAAPAPEDRIQGHRRLREPHLLRPGVASAGGQLHRHWHAQGAGAGGLARWAGHRGRLQLQQPGVLFLDEWKTPQPGDTPEQAGFRASVARGYDVFFVRPMWISDVAWFNSIGMGNPTSAPAPSATACISPATTSRRA